MQDRMAVTRVASRLRTSVLARQLEMPQRSLGSAHRNDEMIRGEEAQPVHPPGHGLLENGGAAVGRPHGEVAVLVPAGDQGGVGGQRDRLDHGLVPRPPPRVAVGGSSVETDDLTGGEPGNHDVAEGSDRADCRARLEGQSRARLGGIDELARLISTRLRRIQYRTDGLLDRYLKDAGLGLEPP